MLNRGLEVPSSTSSCTSAFDYPAELQRNGISADPWQRFTQTIIICLDTGLLGHQCTTMIGRDRDALPIGGVIVGILGAVPVRLYYTIISKLQCAIIGLEPFPLSLIV